MNENFAIQLFEGKKVRIVWDAEQEKYYFSVADIVQVLTDSADVKQYIKRMRNSTLSGVQFVPLLKCWLQMASDARRKLGRSVVSSERASDYIRPIEDKGQNTLPKEDE